MLIRKHIRGSDKDGEDWVLGSVPLPFGYTLQLRAAQFGESSLLPLSGVMSGSHIGALAGILSVAMRDN